MKDSEYTTVGGVLTAWASFYNKMPSQAAIDKWNREVDENGGIHPIQEHWEKRHREVSSTPVENNVAQITLTYVDYKGKDDESVE